MPRNGIDPDSSVARARLEAKLETPPVPPFPLNHDEMLVWAMIVQTRSPQEWSGVDVYFAGDLCRATIALRDARAQLAGEDSVITGAQGGRTVNPWMPVISSLLNQTLRLSARLRLSAQDVGAETNQTTAAARKRKAQAEHRDELSQDDADLIARPRPTPVN